MNWLIEDPTPILIAGVLVFAGLAIALVMTGRGKLIWAMVATAAITVALLIVELVVVTDKERVETTLASASTALEHNDVAAVAALIAPEAADMRSRVESEMGRFQIEEASFRRLEVDFNYYTNPPSAQASILATIKVKDRRGEFPYENLVHPFTIMLRKDGDRWLMTGYDDQDIRGGGGASTKKRPKL